LAESFHDILDIACRRHGTSTAATALLATTTVHRPHIAFRVNTYMGSIDNNTRATIGDVVSHGAKGRDTAKRKSSQTTHRKVTVVHFSQVSL
jgi:hypothetical protein